ncbi:MAG: type VI secretion system baseplate subunit TssF [Gammaproteobacteria bacterium]
MDPRFLHYYNRELQHIREMGGEFARDYPKIAGRLGLSSFECADPYVERLLEAFAFLAARVQLKVDAEFPRFTQHLLDMVYPHYLAPTPSMTVVRLAPDMNEGSLNEGFTVPRGTVLRSLIGKGEQTACEYLTAHEISLWPVELVEAEYLAGAGAISQLGVSTRAAHKAAIRLRIRATAGLTFDQIHLDVLPVFLRGSGELAVQLYEQLIAHTDSLAVMPAEKPRPWIHVLERSAVRQLGFDDSQALLPVHLRSFQGYRLLQEYFAFPDRFLFVEVGGLSPALRRCASNEIDLVFVLKQVNGKLTDAVDASRFALFCTPAVNLFPKRADRIHLSDRSGEYHIVPDRTRPMDYEVCDVNEVTGYGTSAEQKQEFLPFYGSKHFFGRQELEAYYILYRHPRVLSTKQRRHGARSSYIGSETYISLVDPNQAPFSSNLKQLALNTLCTNRDLPLHMPLNTGKTDFSVQSGAPIESVRCLAGPTRPRHSVAREATAWKLISHLSLNYLSLMDQDQKQGARALRELLQLYSDNSDIAIRKQVDGVVSIHSDDVVRRMPIAGPITFGRGLEIKVECDESGFEGSGVFLLGAVLERFFARYASINTFTETVISTLERGEIMRWPIRIGKRHTL